MSKIFLIFAADLIINIVAIITTFTSEKLCKVTKNNSHNKIKFQNYENNIKITNNELLIVCKIEQKNDVKFRDAPIQKRKRRNTYDYF